jgi:hypothetical protein
MSLLLIVTQKLIGMISEGDLIRYFTPKDEFFNLNVFL